MAEASHHHPLLALGFRLLAVICLSTMVMLVKLAGEQGVHVFEIMFWRHFISVPLIAGWLALNGNIGILRTQRFPAHLRRAVLGTVAMVLLFSSYMLLPLAEATTLNFTAPLFATVLSMLILHDHIGPWRWSALAAGFAGVLIITQPGNGHMPLLGAAIGIGAAVMMALLSILIKDLSHSEHPLTIVFWFAILGAPLMGLTLPFVMSAHNIATWGLLLAIGVIGMVGQLLMTLSLRLGTVSSVIVMDYTALIWATLYGWLIWDHLPPAATWFGAPLIIAAGIIIVWRERSLGHAKSDPMLALR